MKRICNKRIFASLMICAIFTFAACERGSSSGKASESFMTEDKKLMPVAYVALGDSTGAGVGASDGRGYVARLFTRIERERPNSRLTNLCVSGATTEDVRRGQVESAIAARPTLVTLGIGINDVGKGVSLERFARNYEEIITRLKAATSAPIVATNIPDISFAPAAPAFMRDEVRRRVNLFNERIEKIAELHELSVVDAHKATREVLPSHPEFFSSDGFHPSEAGYEYWAKTMWPTVKSTIGKDSRQ